MSEWFETLDGLRGEIWRRLRTGAESGGGSRVVALATVGGRGAEARMVALREARVEAAELEVQTDLLSAKVDELRAEPRATLLSWEPEALLQARLRVRVEVVTEGLDGRWAAMPDEARRNHGGLPPPGRPMERAEDYVETRERERLAVLLARVEEIDAVHLGDLHRRALFSRDDGFAGRWIAP